MFWQAPPMNMSAITSLAHEDTIRFETMTLPVLPVMEDSKQRREPRRPRWYSDRWLLALIFCAACASMSAAIWAYQSQSILLYGDAHSHLLIARRVFDNVYPGLAQLGDVWLPLPHLIMVPLAWNDFLWRTGLAGTLTSMPCYLLAAIFVFLTARRLTSDSRAGFIGSLVFVLNPNILYLQSTPLSEPLLFATLAAASYYFVAWAQDDQLRHLIYSALATFLATIARYDGWALYLSLLVMLILICWRKRYSRDKTIAHAMLFGTLGGAGILLWFVWNLVIFGSPLAFLSGSFSSQAQTQSFIHGGYADTYHNLWQSLRTYSLATAESIGPVILALGALAIMLLLIRRRFSCDALAVMTVLVPFAFYVVALFLGQDVMYIPHAEHPPYYLYNARFGSEMAAPGAVFVATLIESARRWLSARLLVRLVEGALVVAIIGQSVALSWGGIISLQDGQTGASCYPGQPIAEYLAEHYDGGRVLMNVYSTNIDLSQAGIPFRDVIYEGDGPVWQAALQSPASYVEWIVAGPHDLVSQHVDTQSVTFLREFTLVAEDTPSGAKLWHRTGLPPLPNRSLPNDVTQPYVACNHARGMPIARTADSPLALMPRSGIPSASLELRTMPAEPLFLPSLLHVESVSR